MTENIQIVSREDIENLQRQVTRLAEMLAQLQKHVPPVAQQRARRVRLIYEISGLALAAVGAFLVYPPLAWILVGGWMLTEVVVSRRQKKGR